MRPALVLMVLVLCGFVMAQEAPPAPAAVKQDQSLLGADFHKEGDRLKENCGDFKFTFGKIGGCANQLFTDHPLHIAMGSLAPQNGIGFGPALVAHKTPNESWRLNWDFDGVASSNGSWRAGGYMKIINTRLAKITVHEPSAEEAANPPKKPKKIDLNRQYPVANLYAQGISLDKIYYFGEGPTTTLAGRSTYGMQEAVVGGNIIYPIYKKLNVELLGEVNGRFITIRAKSGAGSPSILQLYNNVTAPGLSYQPGFAQFAEGIRMKPIFYSDHFQLNYVFSFQQYVAPSASTYSFRRWTLDLGHDFILYGNSQMTMPKSAKLTRPCKNDAGLPTPCPSLFVAAEPKKTNGPDECAIEPGRQCPPVSLSRNREGTISLRLLMSESIASKGSVVPFYLQPTLGGSDINGNLFLGSYQDYRFRAPNMIVIREAIEHNLWGPIGGAFIADEGKVALNRSNVNLSNLNYSVAAGLTLRAGGMPFIYLMFAWGNSEGNHTTSTINSSLLGGSTRPSLF